MATDKLQVSNADPDWPIAENIKERRQDGTYIPGSQPTDALRVAVNGSGTLGTGGEALVVQPGTGRVEDTNHTIESADTRTLDVSLPGGNDRRDAVILTDAGTLEVREGTGGSFEWGDGVASNARTYQNAFRPPPPALDGIPGLVLGIVTIRSGQSELDTDAVDSTVRVGPPPSVLGGRRLSAFDTLEAALQWSSDAPGNQCNPVYVDGEFTFSEVNISLPRNTALVGDWRASVINIDTAETGPLFHNDFAGAQRMYWSGINFYNRQTARAFLVSSDTAGFIAFDTRWRDLRIAEFGSTDTNPYTIDLKDAYASTFENVHVFTHTRPMHGVFRFDNCNAAQFRSLKFSGDTGNGSGDGETPLLYGIGCEGTTIDAPHFEHYVTDAVFQFHYGNVLVNGGHFEAHAGHHNAGIQVGDGGLTAGNTGGRIGPATTVTVVGPTMHDANVSPCDDIRVLNNESVTVVNTQGDGGALRVNYGGSNHDTGLTTDLGDLTLFGQHNATVVNNSGQTNPPVTNIDGGYTARQDSVVAANVYLSADQTIPSGVEEPIAMDTATYGDALFDSANGTITVPEAGLYDVSLNYRMLDVAADTPIQAILYVNGTRELRTGENAETGYTSCGRRFDLAVGDTIEFRCRHADGTDGRLRGLSDLTFGAVERIGTV